MSMIVLREWEVCCVCPECGESMPAIVTIQETHYPETRNMSDHTYLSPLMVMDGADRTFCRRCVKSYDPRQLQPVMVQVSPKI